MKHFCEKQHQHRQWRAVFVDAWSLTFFHAFCWTDKRMNICVPSLRRSRGWLSSATCCSLWFVFCWGFLLLLSSSSSLLSLLLFFLFKFFFYIASFSTWFVVNISNQNFTDGFIQEFVLFATISELLQRFALCKLLCMTAHSCRNVIPRRYGLQW